LRRRRARAVATLTTPSARTRGDAFERIARATVRACERSSGVELCG
jgi:hypothetical protein